MNTNLIAELERSRESYHFSVIRFIMGIYCSIFFFFLTPRTKDLFSADGMFGHTDLHETYGYFPSILYIYDSAEFCKWLSIILCIFGIFLAIGLLRRLSAFVLWYGLCCFFNQNELFWSPALPFVGWQLLAYSLIPEGEPLSIIRSKQVKNWSVPSGFIKIAWLTIGLAYTISGIYKFISPSWFDGSAIRQVMNWTWARDWLYVDLLLSLPDTCLKFLTWFTIASEALFLPLMLFPAGRFVAWFCMTIIQINLLFVVDLFDLTFGVLLFHLFIFDYKWVDTCKTFWPKNKLPPNNIS